MGRALARFGGFVLGGVIGVGLIVSTALPLSSAAATAHLSARAFTRTATTGSFPWPVNGSAAVSVPSLNEFAASPRQNVQPIASLTKMMSAYVILHKLPITLGESGPCLTVSSFDVTLYNEDQETGQSSIRVQRGDQLCEDQLLEGLFVHSAGNYVVMLVHLAHMSVKAFVATMNATAASLGMTHTHYADVTGIDDGSVSTAADQLVLVDHLMASVFIRRIVSFTSVTLPGAGVVTTYTPMLGTGGVVGIKSGWTTPAGGCDAMAVQRAKDGITFLTFAVVLGQPGALVQAGDVAYALSRAAYRQVVATTYKAGEVVGTLGWKGAQTSVALATTTSELFWRHTPNLYVTLAPYAGVGGSLDPSSSVPAPHQLWRWPELPGYYEATYSTSSTIPAGTIVGDVEFANDPHVFLVLYASSTISRPAWWSGLL